MIAETERLKRWRLVLGGGEAEGTGCQLTGADARLDGALENLYMTPEEKEKNRLNVGKGASRPNVARWLGDIREFFPSSVVRVMQQDALERLGLKQMLLEPEMMEAVQPDVHLVATLLSLKSLLKGKAKDTARIVVRRVVEELTHKLAKIGRASCRERV